MKFINLISRTLEDTFYKNLISHFFKEVEDDIKILRQCKPNHKGALDCFFNYSEDDLNDELITKIQEITSKSYKEKYCPTSLFDYFNQSEKMNYLMLRVEIDKLLGIKDTSYKI